MDTEKASLLSGFKQIHKELIRKFRKIDYKNTDLNPGFLELEEEFLKYRNVSKMIKITLKTFKNYEYGHSTLKYMYDGFNWVEKKINTEVTERGSIYRDTANAGKEMSKFTVDKNKKELFINFSDAYMGIDKSKKEFNNEIKGLMGEIDLYLSYAKEINKKRKLVRAIRYDLELAITNDNYDNDLVKSERKHLSGICKETMKDMNVFIKDKKVSDVIEKFQKLHCKFFNDCAGELEKIN